MRRFLGLDLETTGLDVAKDQILKLGAVLYEEGNPVALFEREYTLWHDSYPEINEDAFRTHGITKKSLQEFGECPYEFYQNFARLIDEHHIDFLVAHNGHAFDFPVLINSGECFAANLRNFFRNRPKIDTKLDVPYPGHIKSRGLTHLAAEHGFLNPFPHSALSDIRTMMKIFFMYPLEDIVARSKSETLLIKADVAFELKDLAKRAGFYWDSDKKSWLKQVKACDIEKLESSVDFKILKMGGVPNGHHT